MDRKTFRESVMEAGYKAGEVDFKSFSKGFQAGIEWYISTMWRDNSIRPGEDCDILVETKYGIIFDRYDFDYKELDSGTDWETEVIRWLNVPDLTLEKKRQNDFNAVALEYAEDKTDFRKNIMKEVGVDDYTMRKEHCMEDFLAGIEWSANFL